MRFIYPRDNLLKSIPLMALMAAINIIVSEFAALSLIVSVFLILCLPLTSAIVELCCMDRYFPIYALATFGLSVSLTFWNIQTVFFYVLPSIITGYIFGVMIKNKIPAIWSIFAATLAQLALTYSMIPLVNLIYQIDIISIFKTTFNVADVTGIDIIIPTFIFLISLLQVSLSHLIVSQELPKFKITYEKNILLDCIASAVGVVFGLIIWLLYFFNLEFAYLCLCVSLFFAAYSALLLIKKTLVFSLISIGIVLFINIFVFASLQGIMISHSQLLLLSFSSVCICVISSLFSLLHKKKEKIQ